MHEKSLLVRDLLKRFDHRLVLIESCTAGWVVSQFGAIPGISEFLCGSFVVYRNDSKHRWLGIDTGILEDPKIGPVSERVTVELAVAALTRTPEATISLAVTGHLGPGSPINQDGIVFVSIARKVSGRNPTPNDVTTTKVFLKSTTPVSMHDYRSREERQREAGESVLEILLHELDKA